MIEILWLCGTGFGGELPDGVSEGFRCELIKCGAIGMFRFTYVQYPADYGVRLTYEESLAEGHRLLIEAITESPYPVIIGGYSQGADIAGTVAAEISAGAHPELTVLGAVLIADPWRPARTSIDTVVMGASSGFGIRGQRAIGGMPVFWAANEGDPITALPAGNPLRSLADISEFMSATLDRERANELYTKVLTAVSNGRMQRWWSRSNWRTWGGALAYVRGYLVDGRHTDDYIRHGHCATLARVVMNHPWVE